IKHNLNKKQLLRYINQNLNVNQIYNKIFVNKELIKNLLNSLSIKNIIQDYAYKFGISKDLPPFLSMSLGAGETDLLSLTNAYGMIINGGKKITPTLIDRIQDRRGVTIFKHDKRNCKNCNGQHSNSKNIPLVAVKDTRKKVISSSSAYQMVSMLKGAIERGTGIVINSLGKNLAGKTGTTNSNTDAWFIGFSSDLVVGVFVGFDDPRPLGFKETGSSVAAPIFKDFMKEALLNTPDIPFRRPPGIKLISVNPNSGLQVSAKDKKSILEAFKPGQLPNLSFDKNFIDLKNSNTIIKNLSPLY
ncbi:penicillin-binding transpeptidase domain-containing protein, partial [Alphaproteobacteria bacterium]|nr:penicillin-binding transpeptidase domain-containing protein [Alphaproteobacteria bacterium]